MTALFLFFPLEWNFMKPLSIFTSKALFFIISWNYCIRSPPQQSAEVALFKVTVTSLCKTHRFYISLTLTPDSLVQYNIHTLQTFRTLSLEILSLLMLTLLLISSIKTRVSLCVLLYPKYPKQYWIRSRWLLKKEWMIEGTYGWPPWQFAMSWVTLLKNHTCIAFT